LSSASVPVLGFLIPGHDSSFLAQLPLSLAPSCWSLMDHAQGRAFHHHLARAIMHLNYLAGLLPFFEPSIEYEEPVPPANARFERPTTRGLHTFVPLPASEGSPTLASHGGIPSHMVINPEPHFRPVSTRSSTDSALIRTSEPPRLPIPMTDPGPDPSPGTTAVMSYPRAPTRTTIPVPARSKQRTSSLTDPQPKKKQKSESIPESRIITDPNTAHSISLPIPSERDSAIEARSRELNSDDSDGDAGSGDAINYHHGIATAPAATPSLTLTPNPKAPPSPSLRILHSSPTDPSMGHTLRPWTPADDQELISMKQDTKSRPSWKTIGSRLHRDHQACKMRWAILKQNLEVIDHPDRSNPPPEPEGED
jgi:hypothetical protein